METYPPEELRKLEEKVQVGNWFYDFLHTGPYDLLNKHVLVPMDEGAFEVFKTIKADDHIGIVEAQMMSKVIGRIRTTIEAKINEGRMATETIKQLNSLPEEDD